MHIGSLKLLMPYLAPYKWRAAGACIALLTAAGLLLALGQGLRRLIDTGFAAHHAASLNSAAVVMFAVLRPLHPHLLARRTRRC